MCLLIGAVGVGKTLLLKRLQQIQEDTIFSFTEVPTTIPTVGTNLSTLTFGKKLEMTVRELGGSMAPIWQTYLNDSNIVVFMIDVSNPSQVSASTVLFLTVLASGQIKDAAVLLLLNKIDMPSSLQLKELKYLIHLEDLMQAATQRITVIECSAKDGTGLKEVMAWLSENSSRSNTDKT